jgi:hypothetical protein
VVDARLHAAGAEALDAEVEALADAALTGWLARR